MTGSITLLTRRRVIVIQSSTGAQWEGAQRDEIGTTILILCVLVVWKTE